MAEQPSLQRSAARPAALDPAAYHSFSFAQREDAAIWTREWICIGTHADIPEAGDLLPLTVGDHAVHVQRGASGTVAGRFNQAQHGGCRSVPLQCRQGVKTPCSFTSCGHSLDREPLRASELGEATPEMHQYLGLRTERLLPVRTASLGPLLFVNLDRAGESFDRTSRELTQALPTLAESAWARTDHAWIDFPGNWKLVGQSVASCAERISLAGSGSSLVRSTVPPVRRSAASAVTAFWGFPNLIVLARLGSIGVVTLQPVATDRTVCRVSVFDTEGESETGLESESTSWLDMLRERTDEIRRSQNALEAWGTPSDSQPKADRPLFADKALGGWLCTTVDSSLDRVSRAAHHAANPIHIPIRSIQ